LQDHVVIVYAFLNAIIGPQHIHYGLNYVIYGKKEPRAKVRIRHASVRITEYFNANETESDKRELVNDVNAVDVDKILRSPKPRSVKTDVKTAVKRKPGLLQQIRKIMDVIGKDFVNMYYYRSR